MRTVLRRISKPRRTRSAVAIQLLCSCVLLTIWPRFDLFFFSPKLVWLLFYTSEVCWKSSTTSNTGKLFIQARDQIHTLCPIGARHKPEQQLSLVCVCDFVQQQLCLTFESLCCLSNISFAQMSSDQTNKVTSNDVNLHFIIISFC